MLPFPKYQMPCYSAIMRQTVSIDRVGRIVLPKRLRDDLRLEPGDTLELETKGDRVTLRPLRGASALRKERGVWVHHSGQPLTATVTDAILRNLRAHGSE